MDAKLLDDLIGKSFVSEGRGPDGYDCWGLCLEVYRRFFGIDLPDYRICAYNVPIIFSQFQAESQRWNRIGYKRGDDVSEISIPSVIAIRFVQDMVNHVGVFLGDHMGAPVFIHSREKTGVTLERVKPWSSRIEGFYTLNTI